MPPTTFPPTKPPWNKPADISTTNEFSFKAYTFAATSPQNLLHKVNATWHELSKDTYGDTFHTATPSIWFQQTLSLNLSLAIANHLRGARNKLANPTPKWHTEMTHRRRHQWQTIPIPQKAIPWSIPTHTQRHALDSTFKSYINYNNIILCNKSMTARIAISRLA
jgi:hypothetical protein